MTSDRTILITGVTGNQGGAVAQALQGTGFYLRGLTRKPDSERAAALARQGVDIRFLQLFRCSSPFRNAAEDGSEVPFLSSDSTAPGEMIVHRMFSECSSIRSPSVKV